MKPGLHANYVDATVTCACGSVFQTRSTRKELRTDLCSVCHPFYTGEQRIVDTAGQVERFMKRMQAAQETDRRPSKRQTRIQAAAAEREAQQRRQAEAEAETRARGGQDILAPAETPTEAAAETANA